VVPALEEKLAHPLHGFRHGVSGVERLASGEGRKGLRARLEERVERRGAELQELFGECGLEVGAWGLLRSAVRNAVFFSLRRGPLSWYSSLIAEVREGLRKLGTRFGLS